MADQTAEVSKKKAETSVKTYKESGEAEKQKMADYSKKFQKTVSSLKNDIKKQRSAFKEGANLLGDKAMAFKGKINAFRVDLNKYKRELLANVKLFSSECVKKKKDFNAYTKGFWGI